MKERVVLYCRCYPEGRKVPCVGACGSVCGRLSADLAVKLSPRLQNEWERGQCVLMRGKPTPPCGALPPPGFEPPDQPVWGKTDPQSTSFE